MNRQTIDQTNNWFDKDKAIKIDEGSYWNGSNHISKATGGQFYHEQIYITKSSKIILNCWSQYQGSTESYTEISESGFIDWLVKNEIYELEKNDNMTDKQIELINTAISNLEV